MTQNKNHKQTHPVLNKQKQIVTRGHQNSVFTERSVRYILSPVRLSYVCRLSVTFVRPTQPVEIFGNVSSPFGTLVTLAIR